MEDIMCRICFQKSCDMISMFTKLENSSPHQMLHRLKLLQITDNGSAYICSQCLSELFNCVKFFEKCEKSIKVLSIEYNKLKTSDLPNDHLDVHPDINFSDRNVTHENDEVSPIQGEISGQNILVKNSCTVCGSKRKCIHKTPALYKCNICLKIFTKKFNYNVHVKRHLGLREWPCPACGAPQVTSWLAKRHCLQGSRYVCPAPDCNRSYTSAHNLTVHYRNHTGERPHNCSICNKRFTSKTTLNDHIRTHTGVKPYMCSICGARFTTNKLTAHLRTHTKSKQHNQKFLKSDITRTQRSGTYPCDHCSMRYSHKQSLNRHLRKAHSQTHGGSNIINQC